MNIEWKDLDPKLRQRLADADPELAKSLAIWEKAQETPVEMTNEQFWERVDQLKEEILVEGRAFYEKNLEETRRHPRRRI